MVILVTNLSVRQTDRSTELALLVCNKFCFAFLQIPSSSHNGTYYVNFFKFLIIIRSRCVILGLNLSFSRNHNFPDLSVSSSTVNGRLQCMVAVTVHFIPILAHFSVFLASSMSYFLIF